MGEYNLLNLQTDLILLTSGLDKITYPLYESFKSTCFTESPMDNPIEIGIINIGLHRFEMNGQCTIDVSIDVTLDGEVYLDSLKEIDYRDTYECFINSIKNYLLTFRSKFVLNRVYVGHNVVYDRCLSNGGMNHNLFMSSFRNDLYWISEIATSIYNQLSKDGLPTSDPSLINIHSNHEAKIYTVIVNESSPECLLHNVSDIKESVGKGIIKFISEPKLKSAVILG